MVGVGILDLLGAPAGIFGLAHVAGGLDGGDELEGDVAETDDTDDATSNLAEDEVAQQKAANEDVDLGVSVVYQSGLVLGITYRHHGR